MAVISRTEVPVAQQPAAPATPSPSRSGRAFKLFLGGLIAVGIAVAIWWWNSEHRGAVAHRSPEHAGGSEHQSDTANQPIPVEVVHPQQGVIVRRTGQPVSLEGFQYADLYAKVSGYLKNETVDIGDHVKKDQLLAEIDDPEVYKEAEAAKAALEQAKAMVAQAQARVQTALADEEAAAAQLQQTKAEVERYQADVKYRRMVVGRLTALQKQEALEQQRVDEERAHYDTAVAALHEAQAAVLTSNAQYSASKAKVAQARADLAEAKANVGVADAKLNKALVLVEYTKIRSPYDGVVTLRTFHPGAFIQSHADGSGMPLLTVVRTDKLRAVTTVPDRDIPYLKVGEDAIIKLDAFPGETFHGKVSRFSYKEDPENRTMRTEVDLPNPDNKLHDGMYGIAEVILQHSPHLAIPTSALMGDTKGDKAEVFVVRDGKAHLVPITVGSDDGVEIEVLSGLTPKDEVIVSRVSVTDGTPVVASEKVASLGSHSTPAAH
jgi:RND family efflux transporter MFP subunit